MCGICGILTPGEDITGKQRRALDHVCRLLAHRGPDASGSWQNGPALLEHRRLSIIDLSPEASQPLVNESGDVALVINGEIYNFAELRSELEGRGHEFRSRSDSEVALHLYEDEGVDFVGRLRGMFALAIWDGRRRRLVLARDRFGQKPLFYHRGPEGLVFASEVQALVEAGLVARRYDERALDAYLALQYVPCPDSAFSGVRKLEPGHLLVCRPGGKPETRRYWRLRFDQRDTRPLPELADELRHRLQEAVRLRLVADVPLGAFLSGGIDSSAIVGLMAQVSSRPVKTFSIGFTSKDHSELEFAREVARRFATDHHEMNVEPDMVDLLPRLVRHYGEPFGDTSALPTWYLSHFTRQHVTVALSGDAGDEAFAGYRRYRYQRVGRLLAGLPRPLPGMLARLLGALPVPAWQPLRDFGRRLVQGEAQRYLGLIAHFPWEDRRRLYTPEFLKHIAGDLVAGRFEQILRESTGGDPTTRIMDLDVRTYLPDDILVKVDIASMAHALEVRSPFIDHQVMELAAAIPIEHKLRGLSAKVVLRQAVRDLLPERIRHRGKQGFALPIDRWMREDLAEMARDTLLDATARQRGIFRPRAVEQLIERHARGESRGLQLWNLLMLETWFRTFMD